MIVLLQSMYFELNKGKKFCCQSPKITLVTCIYQTYYKKIKVQNLWFPFAFGNVFLMYLKSKLCPCARLLTSALPVK